MLPRPAPGLRRAVAHYAHDLAAQLAQAAYQHIKAQQVAEQPAAIDPRFGGEAAATE